MRARTHVKEKAAGRRVIRDLKRYENRVMGAQESWSTSEEGN